MLLMLTTLMVNPSGYTHNNVRRHTRKPTLLFRLLRWLLLRLRARAFSGLLFQEPPRSGSEWPQRQNVDARSIAQHPLTW